jgi:hypothetical protein
VLAADEIVRQHITRADLERLLAPENQLGEAAAFVDRVLARWGRG